MIENWPTKKYKVIYADPPWSYYCDECKHFNDEDVPGTKVCDKNHKPRWYGHRLGIQARMC